MRNLVNKKTVIIFTFGVLFLFTLSSTFHLPNALYQGLTQVTNKPISTFTPSISTFTSLSTSMPISASSTHSISKQVSSTISVKPESMRGTEPQKTDLMLLFIPSLSMEHLDHLFHALPSELHPNLQLGAMTLRTASGLNKQHNLITLATGQHGKLLPGWNAYHADEWIKEELLAADKYVQLTGRDANKPIVLPLIFKWQKEWQEKHPDVPEPMWLGAKLESQQIQTLVLGNSDRLELLKRSAPVLVMDEQGQANGLISKEILDRAPFFPTGYKTNWTTLRKHIHQAWKQDESTFTVVELGDLERLTTSWEEMQEFYYKDTETAWFSELGYWLEQLLRDYGQLKEQQTVFNVQSSPKGAPKEKRETVLNSMSDQQIQSNQQDQSNQEFRSNQEIQSNQQSQSNQGKSLAIWIVSPWVSIEAASEGRLLAPFLTWEAGQSGGILTSMTTKQTGIVSNLDFLPTVLHKYGIALSPELLGKVMQVEDGDLGKRMSSGMSSVNNEQQLNNWRAQIDYMFQIYEKRRGVITSFLITIILALVASTIYWWLDRGAGGTKLILVLIGAILLSPLYFLWLTPLIKMLDEYMWIVVLFSIGLLSSIILYKLCSPPVFIGSICLLNAVALIWDMLQGSEWMKRSFLGYDAIIGARFYGIGNEYAGILLGSAIMAVTAFYIKLQERASDHKLYQKKIKRIYFIVSSVWYLFILYLVGAPDFGTNAGAVIAFLLTLPIAQILLFQAKLKAKHFLAIGFCFVVGLFIFIALQMSGEHTHINSLLGSLRNGEWYSFFEIIERKWSMNMRLIKVSLWGKLFVVSLITLLLFFFRARKEEQRGHNKEQVVWYSGFRAILIGAILLLLVNDSGIVAAATTMLYVSFPLIFQRLQPRS